MRGNARILIIVAIVLLAASVAAASNPLLAGPNPGLAVNNSTASQSGTTGTTPAGRTSSTVGVTAPSTGLSGSLTNPVLTGQSGTTVPGITPTTTTTSTAPTTTQTAPGVPVIDQVVSLTRTVESGAPVSVFTVPAGQQLVITDVLITNPATTPSCGAAVGPASTTPTTGVIPPAAPTNGGTTTGGTTTGGTTTGGTTATGTAPASPTTPRAITLGEGTGATAGGVATTAAAESGTGLLCVPPQTSLNLGLTTGLEFASGQGVQLGNTAPAAGTTGGPLHYHLRGFLMSPTGV